MFSPERDSIRGVSGSGMVVDVAFRSKNPARLAGRFRLGGALPDPAAPVKPGRLDALPGLVGPFRRRGAPPRFRRPTWSISSRASRCPTRPMAPPNLDPVGEVSLQDRGGFLVVEGPEQIGQPPFGPSM